MADYRGGNGPIPGERHVSMADRRAAPRYATRRNTAVIGWYEGDAHRTIEATLIDIGMGGFSAWVETFPPRTVPVWLRLDGANPSPWLKATVIATTKTGCLFWTRRRIRLRFLEACPYELLKGAIEGCGRVASGRDPVFQGSDRRPAPPGETS